jgi:hypothetical protein
MAIKKMYGKHPRLHNIDVFNNVIFKNAWHRLSANIKTWITEWLATCTLLDPAHNHSFALIISLLVRVAESHTIYPQGEKRKVQSCCDSL